MQAHTTNQLDIEVTHAEYTARCLADNRERLRQKVIHRFPSSETFFELIRIASQFIVRQILHLRLERVDFLDDLAITGYFFIVIVT